jgi:hypothetical protein
MGCGIGDDGRGVSGWPIFRLSNPILGCFTCYEGLFQQISDRLPYTPIIHEALGLLVPFRVDVFVPGVFRVPIEEIVMDGDLRNIVHVALGNLFACFVYADGRVMYPRRRS